MASTGNDNVSSIEHRGKQRAFIFLRVSTQFWKKLKEELLPKEGQEFPIDEAHYIPKDRSTWNFIITLHVLGPGHAEGIAETIRQRYPMDIAISDVRRDPN